MGRAALLALGVACLPASFSPVAATPSPDTVGFSFERLRVATQDLSHLSRRQSSTVAANLINDILFYMINVTVGTPPQSLALILDTGSSDIWFPANNADICQKSAQNCAFGSYDASSSSTYASTNLPEFQIQYSDGSEVKGAYLSDVLNIGDTVLTNMTMAAGLTINTRGIGNMGIGLQAEETSATTGGFTYPNIINVLKTQGFINTLAYSLWLDDLSATTGTILFGGIDTEKYHGDLVSLPIQTDSQTGTVSSFTVAWTGLIVSGSGQTSDFSPTSPQPAVLDSGTTNTLLPDDVANNIFNGVGVLSDPTYGNVVACSLANDDLTFAFQFGGKGGPIINVSLSEFVTPLLTTDGSQPTLSNGEAACSFALEAAGDSPVIFGDSFLRSAYVVFDLENQQIALAQTNFDSSTSKTNIQAFAVSGGIPKVVSTADAVTVVQTFTGAPLAGPTALTTGDLSGTSRSATLLLTSHTASGSSSSTATHTGGSVTVPSLGGLGTGAKIGIGVAVPVGVILIAVILAGFLIRRRRRKQREQSRNQVSRPGDGHMEEIQEGQEAFGTFHKKPELEAEPVIDPTIKGPVRRKFELRSQGTTKAQGTNNLRATDTADAINTYHPGSHEPQGNLLPELHPDSMLEVGSGTLTEQRVNQLKQQSELSQISTSTSTAVPSTFDPSPFRTTSAEASELAEEADMIVQELGLVNLRKKALAAQASAVGKRPEDVEGRKGEEFRTLLERETKLNGRLDEIEHQRQG